MTKHGWFMHLRRWRFAAIVASATLLTTVVTCFVITRVNHRYTGGLEWPYFSDMGRDPPSYYVFGVGLTIIAMAIALTWLFNREYHRQRFAAVSAVTKPSMWAYCISVCVLFVGSISTIGLPFLAWCSTTACPNVHELATYWFFILELTAILLNTCLSYYIWKVLCGTRSDLEDVYFSSDSIDEQLELGVSYVAPANVSGVKHAFYWQLVCALLLLATAIVYIPVGLAVVGHVPRLTVQQCLDRDLGYTYCTSTMRRDSHDTKLWNYEKKPFANQLRAACQLAAMLALVGYSLSFLFHDYSIVTASPVPTDPPSASSPLTATQRSPGRGLRTSSM